LIRQHQKERNLLAQKQVVVGRRNRAQDRSMSVMAIYRQQSCKLAAMPRKIQPLLFATLAFASAICQTVPTTTTELGKRVQRLMDIEVGFEDMVPKGMSIQAKEVSRRGKSGKDLVVQYHIFVTGVPASTLFKYVDWAVNAESATARLEGISVGKDGILMCAGRTDEQCGDPKKPDDPIEFTFSPLKGEPTRVAFISQDVKIGIVIIADPVEASDKGCTLTAKRMTRAFDLAFLSGTGYAPNSDIHYRVSSEMTSDSVIKSDSSGTIRLSVIPFLGKKKEGTARVKIMEPNCAPEVAWNWGPI
jgi:hypothetical protein